MIVWINILYTPHLFLRILFLVLALLYNPSWRKGVYGRWCMYL